MASMASAGHQVWVGFIDGLFPVVGSVKEAVECILAVAAEDYILAQEKITVINGRIAKKDGPSSWPMSSSGYGSMDSISPGSSLESSARHDTKYELKSVPDVDLKDYIIEAKGKKSQRTGKPPEKSKADQKKEGEIKNMTLQKIQRIYKDFRLNPLLHPLDAYGERSGRGEHVINNGVILFYDMENTYKSVLDEDTCTAIEYELVVRFGKDELYINANALIYGLFSLKLKQALACWLEAPSQECVEYVNYIVQIMNEEEAYVDWLARDKYINESKNRNEGRDRVETIRRKVEAMFTNWQQYMYL